MYTKLYGIYIYVYIDFLLLFFTYIMLNGNEWFQQFPQTLNVPSAPMDEDVGSFKHQLNAKRQRDRTEDREIRRKKRAQRFRIRTLKVRYFPRVVRNPLREVSYWQRNSIKRSNIEGPLASYIESYSEIITAIFSHLIHHYFQNVFSQIRAKLKDKLRFRRIPFKGMKKIAREKVLFL